MTVVHWRCGGHSPCWYPPSLRFSGAPGSHTGVGSNQLQSSTCRVPLLCLQDTLWRKLYLFLLGSQPLALTLVPT